MRADIIAGIALAGLLVPEGIAYAGIAGVPPQMGLYAAMIGMFTYALFGSSRQLAVTPTSSSAAMLAALVAPIDAGDSSRYYCARFRRCDRSGHHLPGRWPAQVGS